MNKISQYIFLEITKGCLLIFFIFLSISWLLQFTRLISLSNLVQVDILTILYLSIFLIPNLITIIMPFVIIFGLITTFLKLNKDRELISIFSLGLSIESIKKPLLYFAMIIFIFLISLNFYISPKIYKNYKIKEFEIRNKINFEKINISNFIEINKDTFLDFKKEKKNFKEVFISYIEDYNNMIYAKEANIFQKENKFIFKLVDGFKITLIENNELEKLEFENYTLEIKNNSYREYNNFDNNTFDIFEDIENKNYLNILYKTNDSFIIILLVVFFYLNNIKIYRLNINSLIIFIFISSIVLITNQILKNTEINLFLYIIFFFVMPILLSIYYINNNKNVQN